MGNPSRGGVLAPLNDVQKGDRPAAAPLSLPKPLLLQRLFDRGLFDFGATGAQAWGQSAYRRSFDSSSYQLAWSIDSCILNTGTQKPIGWPVWPTSWPDMKLTIALRQFTTFSLHNLHSFELVHQPSHVADDSSQRHIDSIMRRGAVSA